MLIAVEPVWNIEFDEKLKEMTDEEYVKERNKLIPLARKLANEKVKNHKLYSYRWNAVFLAEMNRLAKEKGLIKYHE
jgi:hypothetical protein